MHLTNTSRSSSSISPVDTRISSSTPPEAHKNEGFLKSAWHKLTHQQNNTPAVESANDFATEYKDQDEEPKKAAGSG